ncbi:ABC transporter permease [bacterium]|nr:ABC transporter permease [bacterium]
MGELLAIEKGEPMSIMRLSSLEFLIEEAFKNLTRNVVISFASITTVTLTLLVVGVVGLAMVNIEYSSQHLPGKLEVAVFLKRNVPLQEAIGLANKVKSWEGVKEVKVVSKEEAWQDLKKELKREVDLSDIPNPLPHALRIKTVAPQYIISVAETLRKEQIVDEVREGREVAEKLQSLNNLIKWTGISLGLFLLLASSLIIGNAVRLAIYARREEIRIMQLVGATNFFIMGPFVLEGTAYSIFGGLLAFLILLLAYIYIYNHFPLSFFLLLPYQDVALPLFAAIFLLALLIGVVSSFLSTRYFLYKRGEEFE